MQSVPREWLDFLRQQFPKDSRIQLTEIGGNPRPISPGSTGKLDYIDDAGQFHVKWDNGEEHYGVRGIVPFFCEDKELAGYYLNEVRTMWDVEMGEEQDLSM